MIFTSSLSYFVVVCSTDSTFFTSTKGWKNLEKYFLSYISVFFCKCYEGIYWRNLSLLQVKLPPNPSIPRQSITFSPLKQLLEVECGCYLKIFSISTFSLNHGIQILHDIINLNVTHQCTTQWITVQLVYVYVFTCPDATYIYKENSLTSFCHSGVFIDPDSYTWPWITTWGSGLAGIITTSSSIKNSHFEQDIYKCNKICNNGFILSLLFYFMCSFWIAH